MGRSSNCVLQPTVIIASHVITFFLQSMVMTVKLKGPNELRDKIMSAVSFCVALSFLSLSFRTFSPNILSFPWIPHWPALAFLFVLILFYAPLSFYFLDIDWTQKSILPYFAYYFARIHCIEFRITKCNATISNISTSFF